MHRTPSQPRDGAGTTPAPSLRVTEMPVSCTVRDDVPRAGPGKGPTSYERPTAEQVRSAPARLKYSSRSSKHYLS